MARLGSILGAILAELDRARVAADHAARELVNEYRADPILASLSVPRVHLDQAELTLRFSVLDLAEEEPATLPATTQAEDWTLHVSRTVLPPLLTEHGVPAEQQAGLLRLLVGSRPVLRIPVSALLNARTGDPSAAAKRTAGVLLSAWETIPQEYRRKLGTKTAFRQELEAALSRGAAAYAGRMRETELIRAALASRISIGIRSDELPSQPERVHELKLTLRGEDISVIVQETKEA